MLNINFNEAWNDLDSLNETDSSNAETQFTYEAIKQFLNDFCSGPDNIDYVKTKAREINSTERQLIKLKADLKQKLAGVIGSKQEYMSEYNKFKAFENKINKKAYKHGSYLSGPRRLALIYNTYLVEKHVDSEIKQWVIDKISDSENQALDQPIDKDSKPSLDWQNKENYFSIATMSNPDFMYTCGSDVKFGVEVKIAFKTTTLDDCETMSTEHAHSARYIVRYFTTGEFSLYKVNEEDRTKFNRIDTITSQVEGCLDIDSFLNYWPKLDNINIK